MSLPEGFSPNSLRRLLSKVNEVAFRDEKGEIEYFGRKVVILRRDSLQLMKEELSKRGAAATAGVILSILGRQVGIEEGSAMITAGESQGVRDWSLNQFVKMAAENTNMGYGKIELKEFTPGAVTVEVRNSFEASPDAHSTPSCFFMLGYLEGLFSKLLNKQMAGVEVECIGNGANTCKFKLSSTSPPARWKL